MKYQSLLAFDKHLEGAFPMHLSRVYFIASPIDYERKQWMQKVVSVFLQKDAQAWLKICSENTTIEEVLEALNTQTIFGSFSLIVFDGIQRLKRHEIEALGEYISRPSPFAYLLLGSSTFKGQAELYQKGKKEMVVLDLSEEKSWEKESRLKQWAIQYVKKEGKSLTAEALSRLFEEVGMDMAALQQELDKLLCFIGKREKIEEGDIAKLCFRLTSENCWQLAQQWIWEETVPNARGQFTEMSAFLTFIGQLRYHLYIGQKLQALGSQNKPWEEIVSYFPKVKETSLKHYFTVVQKRDKEFFPRAFLLLFEIEFLCKNGSLTPGFLCELFVHKLQYLKFHEKEIPALSIS